MSKAKFITFEGVDGAGKSTHLQWFAETLRQRGLEVLVMSLLQKESRADADDLP